jgi:ParB family chromosome partitioning protein
MPLDAIKPRPNTQTRPANPTHVAALAESIAAVGLISPIAVDTNGVLLAGLHRLEAIRHIKSATPKRYKELFGAGVPVRKFDFDATTDPSQALALEATENEQRRDYSPSEVRQLADRLVKAGYRNTRGKPKAGQKALAPALAIIIGKSTKTVQRYLQPGPENKTDVPISIWSKRRSTLRKWRDDAGTLDNGPEIIETIDRLLGQLIEADEPPPPL